MLQEIDTTHQPIQTLSKMKGQAIEKKEFLYNFVNGGWNSEFAKTRQGAIAQAKKRWKDNKNLIVNEKTFRISTPLDYKLCMSLFY